MPPRFGNRIATVSVNHDDSRRIERTGPRQDMAEQGLAGKRMQDLGQIGVHARALARSEDNDVHEPIRMLRCKRKRLARG